MNFINKLKKHGISRLPFFILVILWSIPHSILTEAFIEAGKKDISLHSAVGIVYILLLFFLAIIVYLRMLNANATYKLAILCCFIPFLQAAPIIAGIWYKTDDEHKSNHKRQDS